MTPRPLITLAVGPLEVKCYIVWDEGTKEAFVIDAGGHAERIKEAVEASGLDVKCLVNTHGHFDHIGALSELSEALGAPTAIHPLDVPLMDEAPDHAVLYGLTVKPAPKPDILLEDGATIEAGALSLTVLHTPGHSKGGVCLYEKNLGLLFTGDTLFAGSIGRTDFEGGSLEELMRSIRVKLLDLGDDVVVLPGHGPASTIGAEKATNPFITGFDANGGEVEL